jgi:uncharacterized protein YbjQ (UPF0145 family)
MKVTTTETEIEGAEILGIVTGNTVRSKNLGKDFLAALKSVVGGELEEYTNMLADARDESMNRMINNAKKLEADAVVNVRFTTAQTIQGAAELLAYGTAIKYKKDRQ